MKLASQAIFPPFRLDLQSEQLFRGAQGVPLRPKTFAVLRHLVGQAGRLVTRAELVTAVWQDAHGSDALPKGCIRELRETLGDRTGAPRFIESVARRGYRFIAPVTFADGPESRPGPTSLGLRRSLRVGRDAELEWLGRALERAVAGERKVVFVTGEPGIGKTTVVEAFCQQVGDVWLARGQCVEQYGAGEAYLPVLEALGRLCREPGGEALVGILDRHAPTWLVQMPALVGPAELEALQRRVQGASRERMLREMTDAVEVMACERPLVLVLEDLHWSDQSTIDLLSALARRQDPARLLVLGTYRPADLIVTGHALRAVHRELAVRGQCDELALRLLTAAEVSRYLDARFPEHDFPAELGPALHRGTDGNPLFMVNVVEDLAARGSIAEVSGRWRLEGTVGEVARGAPESLRQLIESHIERLTEDDRRLLETASVAGTEFSAAAVAAGLTLETERVEEHCNRLVRRGEFLRAAETLTLADRSLAARYEFLHGLYATVLYDRLPAARRARLHQQLGKAEEDLRGERAGEIAAQLAVHFERARDHPRALRYLRQAAENALGRHAQREAMAHLTKALGLIDALPDTPARAAQELPLQVMLGGISMATEGYAAPEVKRTYDRARALSGQLGDVPELFPMLRGLHRFYLSRAQIDAARELAARCRRLARRSGKPALLVEAHLALGESACYVGELRTAGAHLKRALTLMDAERPRVSGSRVLAWDPRVSGRYHEALVLWLRGRPDAAVRRIQEARSIAEASGHPFDLTYALFGCAFLHQLRREPEEAARWADAGHTGAVAHGYPVFAALGTIFRGWVLAARERGDRGFEAMRRGYAALQATESVLMNPYWLALVAEASAGAERIEEGLALIASARAALDRSGETWCQAELHRIEGELMLRSGPGPITAPARRRAERSFLRAIETAHRQGALSFELRAATSLARLWHGSARAAEARRRLEKVYRRVADGPDTPDARDARALLEELKDASQAR